MSTKQQEERGAIANFVLAKVGGKFLRFANSDTIPKEGVDEGPYNTDIVKGMTKEAIGELYSSVAGVSPKNFKDKRVAIESLVYQVGKMPIFDPNTPKPAAGTAPESKGKKVVAEGDKFARKNNEAFELLQPAESEKVIGALAPQARELLLIMTELAKEKGSTSFTGADLNAKLKIQEVSARLRTKQDPLRILQYYRGKLIGSGLIRTS